MVWRGRLKSKDVKCDVKYIFKKIKVANGLIRNIKGYHIHVFSSSNSFIEKSKNPVKDFCWWDLHGVCVSVVCAVVDGSLDLSARATSFFI